MERRRARQPALRERSAEQLARAAARVEEPAAEPEHRTGAGAGDRRRRRRGADAGPPARPSGPRPLADRPRARAPRPRAATTSEAALVPRGHAPLPTAVAAAEPATATGRLFMSDSGSGFTTSDRRWVLPWRRRQVDVEVAPLIAASHRHRRRRRAIERAIEVARVAHADQGRRSGEPYIGRSLGVAMILAGLGLDDVTVAAALLHDAVEDATVTCKDLEEEFGPDVAAIVAGSPSWIGSRSNRRRRSRRRLSARCSSRSRRTSTSS